MSTGESQAAFDHAVAVLGVEAEYILNGHLDHGDCIVSDDEPYSGFEGVWVYVNGGQARLLCRWVTEGDGDVFADEDWPDGDFGDVTLDSLDLAQEPRRRVEAWAAEEAEAAGYQIGELTAVQAARKVRLGIENAMRVAARRTGAVYQCSNPVAGVTEHILMAGGRRACIWFRVCMPQADGDLGSVECHFAPAAGVPYEDLSLFVNPGGERWPGFEPAEFILNVLRRIIGVVAGGDGELRELPR